MAAPKKRKPRTTAKATPGAVKVAPNEAAVVKATAKPAPEPPPKEEPKKEKTVYELRTWKGKQLYQCPECPFNSVDNERAFWLHYAQKHTAKRETPGPSGLVGPNGQPL
jgi:hypothetical protein